MTGLVNEVVCDVCAKAFRGPLRIQQLGNHIAFALYSHESLPPACDHCAYAKAQSKTHLAHHIFVRHPDAASPRARAKALFIRAKYQKSNQRSKFVHTCDDCGEAFKGSHNIALHQGQHHIAALPVQRPKPMALRTCDVCRELMSKNNISRHWIYKHAPRHIDAVKSAVKVLAEKHRLRNGRRCDDCGERRSNRGALLRHWMRFHISDRGRVILRDFEHKGHRVITRNPCDDCDKLFHQGNLFRHWTAKHGRDRPV